MDTVNNRVYYQEKFETYEAILEHFKFVYFQIFGVFILASQVSWRWLVSIHFTSINLSKIKAQIKKNKTCYLEHPLFNSKVI